MKKYEVFFFPNGTIAVTEGENQITELQTKGVPALFAEFVESKGYDPTDFQLHLGSVDAVLFKTKDGWNWGVSDV